MDGRGGCCIARYGGGVYDHLSKVDRIMLRFRPIAPKPATGGAVSSGSTSENGEAGVKSGRGKRRYARYSSSKKNKRCGNRKGKSSPEGGEPVGKATSGGSVSGGDAVVTLPLLPETPDRKEVPARESASEHSDMSVREKQVRKAPIWLNFGRQAGVGLDRAARVVASTVTVECVMDTWVAGDGYGLGRTDEERRWNLERDTCPGFISDGLDRVGWTNGAYREMVGHDGGDQVMVWLVMKDRLPLMYPAVTCRVRVQYACGQERNSLTLPCDVWRMDGGGFAWKLDVKAALSLGR